MVLLESAGGASSIILLVGYIIFFVVLMYFIAIRPQKKQQKQLNETLASMEVGDSVLTTSGFYGVVLDITDDVVIVEFGNNKNCRIPMHKNAVAELEKQGSAVVTEDDKEKDKDKSKDKGKNKI